MNCGKRRINRAALLNRFINFGNKPTILLRIIFSALVLIFCSSALLAQPQNYLFAHLGLKDGLTQQNIGAVQQDARGFIWIAAGNTLQRYDGYHFLNFRGGTKGLFPYGAIRSMQMDAKNRLWILNGDRSVGYLDPFTFRYHAVKINAPDNFDNTISALYIDNLQQVLLIYVNQGFITLNEKAGEASARYNAFTLPAGWEPTHFWQDAENNYWVGTINGLLKYNSLQHSMYYRGHQAEADSIIAALQQYTHIRTLYRDQERRFWFSCRDPGLTIMSYDPRTGIKKQWQGTTGQAMGGVYYDLWGFTGTANHHLWMGGPGIFARVLYDQNRVLRVAPDAAGEFSIRYDQVNSLFEDREKSIWVSTNKGLFRFNPPSQLFTGFNNSLPYNNGTYVTDVTGFLQTADGNIVVSTWGNGIFRYDSNFRAIAPAGTDRLVVPGNALIWCMLQRKNGDIWCGLQDGWLHVYEAASRKTFKMQPDAAAGRSIRQLAEDSSGNVWIGTQGGRLVKWTAGSKAFVVQQQLKGIISKLLVDSNGDLWVCTDRDGVYRLNTRANSLLAHYTATGESGRRLLMNGAADILRYDDTTIVIISNGLNILHTRTGRFSYLNGGSELYSAVKDRDGFLWITGAAGILCQHLKQPDFEFSFDARDGVYNFSFNAGVGTLLANGKIVFGTNRDLLVFDPRKLSGFNFDAAEVQVAGLSVMDKWLPVDSVMGAGALNLPYANNSVALRLSTNTFQSLFSIQYMMEGRDEAWKQANANGEINLSYLPPGQYHFVAACPNNQGGHGKALRLLINVAPPFYRTWWFYSAVALALGCLLFWLDKERMKRQAALQKMRSSIAVNLHTEVSTTLGNINILSEMAKLKAITEPQKSVEFIEQLHGKSSDMIQAMDDMMWSISPENDSMAKTILRMQEYLQALNSRYGSSIEMLVDEKLNAVKADMQFRYEAFILFRESITGLAESGCTHCSIHLGVDRSQLLYTIQFSTQSCDMQKLNNLLHSRDMGKRMEAIKATLQVDMHKSNTVLTLKVPVRV
jgi:ligand-binding sensor domain-containing protein